MFVSLQSCLLSPALHTPKYIIIVTRLFINTVSIGIQNTSEHHPCPDCTAVLLPKNQEDSLILSLTYTKARRQLETLQTLNCVDSLKFTNAILLGRSSPCVLVMLIQKDSGVWYLVLHQTDNRLPNWFLTEKGQLPQRERLTKRNKIFSLIFCTVWLERMT